MDTTSASERKNSAQQSDNVDRDAVTSMSTHTVCESEDGGWTQIPRRSKRVQVNKIATDKRELFGVHKQPDRRRIENVLSKYEHHVRSATQDNVTTKQTDNVEKNTERTMNIQQASEADNTRRKNSNFKEKKAQCCKVCCIECSISRHNS